MIRSICIVSRDYPPDATCGDFAHVAWTLATAFAASGVAVHVITQSRADTNSLDIESGVAIHRINLPDTYVPSGSELDRFLWANRVSSAYRELDAAVGFDVILGPDRFGETAKIEPGVGTLLALQLHHHRTFDGLVLPDERDFPTDHAIAQFELMGMRRADLVVAPMGATSNARLADSGIATLALPTMHLPAEGIHRAEAHEFEMLYIGDLTTDTRPESAIATMIELRRRGLDAHLSIVGHDSAGGIDAKSYRDTILVPYIDQHAGPGVEVDFEDRPSLTEVIARIRGADVLIVPDRSQHLRSLVVEALAAGVPVVAGEDNGLGSALYADGGLVAMSKTNNDIGSKTIADRLTDPQWLKEVGEHNKEAVSRLTDPAHCVDEYFEALSRANPHARIPSTARCPTRVGPKLGIIMLTHNCLSDTKRAVLSLLEHTDVPFELVVVDNASTDGTATWLSSLSDPRLRVIASPVNHGVPGGRNVGIDALCGDEDFVVFFDNDIEVSARWWEPYVGAFNVHLDAGVVGDEGYRVTWSMEGPELDVVKTAGTQRCDSIAGYCMVVRKRALDAIGRFDERLGLFWHDSHDFAMRAGRIGEAVLVVGSGRVLHYGPRSSITVEGIWTDERTPSPLAARNARYLAQKRVRQSVRRDTPFMLIADLQEVIDHPALLGCYAGAFTKDDEVALLLYGPGVDAQAFHDRFAKTAASIGFDVEQGPRIIAMLPEIAEEPHELTLSDEVYGMLSTRRPTGPFQQLAWLSDDDADRVRILAAKAWRARPNAAATFATMDSVSLSPEVACEADIDAVPIRLNLGAGELRVPGFLSVDLREEIADVVADVTALPYADGVVQEILAFDILEHFPADRTRQILKEWGRVLATGGALTLKVPNLQALGAMINDDGEFATTYIENVYGGHRFGPDGAWDTHHTGWTPRLLRDELARAGFVVLANDLEPNMTVKARKTSRRGP